MSTQASSTTTTLSTITILLPITPCIVSFLYSVSIQIFLAMWNECSWLSLIKVWPVQLSIVIGFSFLHQCITLYTIETTSIIYSCFLFLFCLALSVVSVKNMRRNFIQGPKPSFPPNQLTDKVILITGANTGIGKETAKQLLEYGATVVFACRSQSRAKEAMSDILSISSNKTDDLKTRMKFIPLDLSDLNSVQESITHFQKLNIPLHILINNAGVMMGTRTESRQGYELTMQCNHLGHFLLTLKLLPLLKKNSNSKIINITSSTYTLAKNIDVEDLLCSKRSYSLFSQYAQSKLANILFTKELIKREPSITSMSVHPGLVRTNVTRNMPWLLQMLNSAFASVLKTLQKTPEEGAFTTVNCVCNDHFKGLYFVNSQQQQVWNCARDDEGAVRLWKRSEELVGFKYKYENNSFVRGYQINKMLS